MLTDDDKINILSAIVIISRRLLKLETSEKYRELLREMIKDFGKDLIEHEEKTK